MQNAEKFITVLTSQVIGPALNWAVAKSEGIEVRVDDGMVWEIPLREWDYTPSEFLTQGDSIIDRERIVVIACNPLYFPKGNAAGDHYEPYNKATSEQGIKMYGPTPLIAAMRCFVGSKMGQEIQIPMSLWNDSMPEVLAPPDVFPSKRNKP